MSQESDAKVPPHPAKHHAASASSGQRVLGYLPDDPTSIAKSLGNTCEFVNEYWGPGWEHQARPLRT